MAEVELRRTVKYDFGGKVALITGGASGLGLATARRLIESNAHVVIADYSDKVYEIAEQYGLVGIKCNVTKEEDLQKAVDLAVEKFGHLDLGVASACQQRDRRRGPGKLEHGK